MNVDEPFRMGWEMGRMEKTSGSSDNVEDKFNSDVDNLLDEINRLRKQVFKLKANQSKE